jgi:hypothetical protein
MNSSLLNMTCKEVQMRQHAYIPLWFLCWALAMPAASRVWAADPGLAVQDGLSYKVSAIELKDNGRGWGLLTVRRAMVILSNSPNGAEDLETPCSDFVGRTKTGRQWEKKDSGKPKFISAHALKYQSISIIVHQESVDYGAVDTGAVLRQIREACGTQQAEEPHRLQLEREEAARRLAEEPRRMQLEQAQEAYRAELEREETARLVEEAARQRKAAAAKRAADFRDGILTALRAAEEPDPFASIRGDFDFSGSDSRLWKTSLRLPDAEKCGLLKTPSATPTSGSAWTFACTFRATRDGYEGMVKSVQSVLHLPYQPDERAVNINQVFFADPSRPASSLFVAKINEATVGISVVAVRSTGASLTTPNAAPFSGVPTMLPAEPTVRDEVEKIRSGPYAAMPPAQRAAVSVPAVSGRTTMTVKNSTAYELSVFFDGPVSTKLTLMPDASQDLDLTPGTFHVAGRVAAANVLPFYGEETYAGSARYSLTFYIGR